MKRLKDAGGILLGKTNVPEMCTLGVTRQSGLRPNEEPLRPQAYTRWEQWWGSCDHLFGWISFGLGTDIGDSIRSPSHYCGIAGIKPNSRRVPETGMLGAFPLFMATWNSIGPMARYVEDLELVLRVISGPDGMDYNTVPAPLFPVCEVPLDKLKVAYFIDDGVAMPSKETQESVERAAKELSAAGLTVVKDRPEGLDKLMDLFKWLCVYLLKDTAEYWWKEYARMADCKVVRPRYFVNEFICQWMDYLEEHHDWSDENRFRLELELHQFRQRMMAFMQKYDVLLSPVLNEPAGLHTTPEEMEKLPVAEVLDGPNGQFLCGPEPHRLARCRCPCGNFARGASHRRPHCCETVERRCGTGGGWSHREAARWLAAPTESVASCGPKDYAGNCSRRTRASVNGRQARRINTSGPISTETDRMCSRTSAVHTQSSVSRG